MCKFFPRKTKRKNKPKRQLYKLVTQLKYVFRCAKKKTNKKYTKKHESKGIFCNEII